MWKNGLLLMALLLAAGCTPVMRGEHFVDPSLHEFEWGAPVLSTQPATTPDDTSTPTATAPAAATTQPEKPSEPRFTRIVRADDPPILIRPQVNLSVYQLAVPAGTASRTEEFWKRLDEEVLDISTRDILQKNGLRVGLGQMRQMQEILAHLNKGPVQTSPAVFITHTVRTIELPMKQGVPEQTIYHFDARDNLAVRTYDQCDNIITLEFQPAPRKAGDVRVSLCPIVRTQRRHVRAVGDNATREIEIFQPERLYDVGLQLDLPADRFLVLAPSSEAHSAMSIGNTFLMHDAATERLESILIIVPQAIFKPDKPAEVRADTVR